MSKVKDLSRDIHISYHNITPMLEQTISTIQCIINNYVQG